MSYDYDRYERQMILPGVGREGQERLRKAKVLLVGAGGLGSPIAFYLAGAGIGTLGIVDADEVSLSNLHRQIIHEASAVGKNKAQSAKENLMRRNDEVDVRVYPFMLNGENADELIEEYDFVVDAVDNFETRFLINDVCVKKKKPFCHGGILGFQGQAMTYVPGQGPCYRCIFEDVPNPGEVLTGKETGIMGPAVGVIACVQALETLKYFLGIGELLTGKMYIFDGLTMKTRIASFPHPTEGCKACGHR